MIFKALVCLCFAALSVAVVSAAAAAQPQITDINRELESLGPDPFLRSWTRPRTRWRFATTSTGHETDFPSRVEVRRTGRRARCRW